MTSSVLLYLLMALLTSSCSEGKAAVTPSDPGCATHTPHPAAAATTTRKPPPRIRSPPHPKPPPHPRPSPPPRMRHPPPPPKTSWALRWSDEFPTVCEGASGCVNGINSDNWGYQLGDGSSEGLDGWGNASLMCYTNSSDNSAVVPTPGTSSGDANSDGAGDGSLHIRANYVPGGATCYNGPLAPASSMRYTSASLTGKGLQSFLWTGPESASVPIKVEARIRIPMGNGTWPAFWMLPAGVNAWCRTGEIDIMEHRNEEHLTVAALHYGGTADSSWTSCHTNSDHKYLGNLTSEDWHTYGLIWSADLMHWQRDGLTYHTVNSTEWSNPALLGSPYAPFNVPFSFILNLAIGGYFTGFDVDSNAAPYDMYVDYVRVWDLHTVGSK